MTKLPKSQNKESFLRYYNIKDSQFEALMSLAQMVEQDFATHAPEFCKYYGELLNTHTAVNKFNVYGTIKMLRNLK